MKFAVGTRWIMTTDDGFEIEGVVLNHTDDRIQKIKMPDDICMYFPRAQWGTTYDADFLEGCCVPWPESEPKPKDTP